jgi:hypothetical protein
MPHTLRQQISPLPWVNLSTMTNSRRWDLLDQLSTGFVARDSVATGHDPMGRDAS